jgi:formylglycine-generating enzyme required for sulfatase activity/predicted Ser/Thr protein kinase
MNPNHLPSGHLLHQRYSIQKCLGQGGFGITYLAYDQKLEQEVCIKELFVSGNSTRGANLTVHSQTTGEFSFPDFVQRFIQEARQLARFQHTNIVRVIDIFEENHTAYTVMEFIAGETLKEKIQREGAMNPQVALKLIAQLLDAVEEVHAKGMLHRDIKPDNILLSPEGRVVLIDFGSARDFTEGKTTTQTAMLTPGYSPIEQYSNRAQRGPYTDIYALGATIYYLITGEKPLAATDRNLEELKAPHILNPKVSSQVSSAVLLAMDMKPENRFQQIKDMREALSSLQQREQNPPPPAPNPPDKKVPPVQENQLEKNKKSKRLYLLLSIAVLLVFVFVWANQRLGKTPIDDNQNNEAEQTNENELGSQAWEEQRPTASDRARAEVEALRIADSMMQVMEAELAAAEEVATASQQNNSAILQKLQNDMVYVAGGTFTMGCTAEQEENCYISEKPAHQVSLNAFYIGKYEVTQAQWYEVMGNNPSYFSGCNNCPVENVSWNDVQDFIRKLNQKTGKNFRLPTEAEWEYAARGGNQSRGYKYAGGDRIYAVAWHDNNSENKIHTIGQKSPNELGIYDMSGNVWEWCYDWYGAYPSTGQNNPSGPSRGSDRVYRGGSWYFDAIHCRIAYRNSNRPDNFNAFIGFRLVSPK